MKGKIRVSEKGLKNGLEFSFGGTRDFEKRDVDFVRGGRIEKFGRL